MRFLVACTITLLLSACLNQPDCIVTTSNNVKISLYKVNVDSAHFVKFSSIKVSGTDSLFQNVKDSVESLTLPVNPSANQTTFTFKYTTTIDAVVVTKTDSVTLGYVKQNIVISPECGGYVYYTNLSVLTSSFVQSGAFLNPLVVNNQLSKSATINLKLKL